MVDWRRCDLHTHTWYSDGTLSPGQLMAMAKQKGIETISITDHDGIRGLEEGAAAAEEYGIRFIPGVEFSAEAPASVFPGLLENRGEKEQNRRSREPGDGAGEAMVYMHLLGYAFDPKDQGLLQALSWILEERKRRNDRLLQALKALGYSLSAADMEMYPGQDYIGKPNIAAALVRRGYAADLSEAFSSESMMASPEVKAIHRKKIRANEAIDRIRRAGGFVSLAHPYKVSWPGSRTLSPEEFERGLRLVIKGLKSEGISALECYYNNHSRRQGCFLSGLAEEWDLTVTGGSDYHGPGVKKEVELGGIHGF